MKALTRTDGRVISTIIYRYWFEPDPYSSFQDFEEVCGVSKVAVVNALDRLIDSDIVYPLGIIRNSPEYDLRYEMCEEWYDNLYIKDKECMKQLTYTEANILSALIRHESYSSGLNFSSIKSNCGVSKEAVVNALDRLIDVGLVVAKSRDPRVRGKEAEYQYRYILKDKWYMDLYRID